MTQSETNPKAWNADEGKAFQRVTDNQLFGTAITLGTIIVDGVEQEDSISNYIEVDYTEETSQQTSGLTAEQLAELEEIING